VPADEARVSTLAIALPYASRWFPAATFDMREMLQLHARGIAAVVAQAPAGEEGMAQERKRQAYTVTAELYLLQHSCHWFCRSATVASVRLIALHQTSYEQVLRASRPPRAPRTGSLPGCEMQRQHPPSRFAASPDLATRRVAGRGTHAHA